MRVARIALVFSLLVSACASAVWGAQEPVLREFSAWLVRPGRAPLPDITARGESGRIRAEGVIGTAHPCFDITGHTVRTRREITLKVIATQESDGCISVVGAFAYEGVIENLHRGTYRFRIMYVFRDRRPVGPGYTVVEQDLQVLEQDVQVR